MHAADADNTVANLDNIIFSVKDESITHNIFEIKDNESIMCGFYCIAFNEYIPAGITFLD